MQGLATVPEVSGRAPAGEGEAKVVHAQGRTTMLEEEWVQLVLQDQRKLNPKMSAKPESS